MCKSIVFDLQVDVVLSDDRGFWNAIETFMSISKRPIVMTASDRHFISRFPCHVELLMLHTPQHVCPFYFFLLFSARCNIYISRLCYDASVRLSVTEVHCGHGACQEEGRGHLTLCYPLLGPLVLLLFAIYCCVVEHIILCWQWRNKVAVGPRASIPKGPPLPQKNF